jgi:hypothetical protein
MSYTGSLRIAEFSLSLCSLADSHIHTPFVLHVPLFPSHCTQWSRHISSLGVTRSTQQWLDPEWKLPFSFRACLPTATAWQERRFQLLRQVFWAVVFCFILCRYFKTLKSRWWQYVQGNHSVPQPTCKTKEINNRYDKDWLQCTVSAPASPPKTTSWKFPAITFLIFKIL